MYTLRLTRVLLSAFAEDPDERDEAPTTALGDWYGMPLRVGIRDLVVCISVRSFLTVVFPAPAPPDLPEHLAAALVPVLRDLDVPAEAIVRELDAMADGRIGATRDRRVRAALVGQAARVGRLVGAVTSGQVDARALHRTLATVQVRHAPASCGAQAARLLDNRRHE